MLITYWKIWFTLWHVKMRHPVAYLWATGKFSWDTLYLLIRAQLHLSMWSRKSISGKLTWLKMVRVWWKPHPSPRFGWRTSSKDGFFFTDGVLNCDQILNYEMWKVLFESSYQSFILLEIVENWHMKCQGHKKRWPHFSSLRVRLCHAHAACI